MRARAGALLVVPFLGLLLGCGAAEDVAGEIAGDVASQAGNAAANEVKRQVCAPVKDGKISTQDRAVLGGLVAAAKAAGVSAEITGPLEEIARSGDAVPLDAVTELREACA